MEIGWIILSRMCICDDKEADIEQLKRLACIYKLKYRTQGWYEKISCTIFGYDIVIA